MRRLLPLEERFLGDDDHWASPEKAGCVVVPVPYERTSSYGQGSARGPEAILQASHQVEFYDVELGFEPREASGGIITSTPLPVDGVDGESLAEQLHDEVTAWIAAGKFVLTLGGEHASVIGAIRAHVNRWKGCTVLQLDAHSDLRICYEGDAWSHACAMARVLDFHDRLVQVGIRSEAAEEADTRIGRGIPCFHAHRLHDSEAVGEDWIGDVIACCGEYVYITFDADVFDPSVLPATGTPEPGGLTWRQINRLLSRLCRERRVVGLDLSELSPIEGLSYPEFTLAKLMYRFAGWVFQNR